MDIVNYDENVTRLYKYIEKEKWDDAARRCKDRPEEARVWVYRKNPDGKTIRWCVLPIHQACARHCPEAVMSSLLVAYPNGVKKKSFQMASEKTAPKSLRDIDYNDGNLPVHFACEWGVDVEVISMLLSAFPESVQIHDRRGLTAMNIAMRGKYENKDQIMSSIDSVEHKLEVKDLEAQMTDLTGKLRTVDASSVTSVASPVQPSPESPRDRNMTTDSIDEEDLHAKLIMVESENTALKETVHELTKKVSYLSNSLEAMVSMQMKVVKMTTQQEKNLIDLAHNIKKG